MSLVALVLVVAAVTVGSRVLALAVLPPPTGRLADVVQRLPAPLFAGLAALSLTSAAGGGAMRPPLVAAVLCAVVSARWRSLLLVLAAGLAGYLLASLVW